MTKTEKASIVEELTQKFNNSTFFYITDSSELTVAEVNQLRRLCFGKNIEMRVAKNTLIKKALEASEKDYEQLYETLVGPTSIMFSDVSNAPAKLIKEFRKTADKPILKGAAIETDFYLGDDQVNTLADLKSKEELVGEIIALLQSPAKNVIGALKSSGGKIAGILKTLSEREEAA